LLASLDEDARAVAHARFEILRPHLEDGVPLTNAADAAGVPLRTAQRWLARYRAGGLAGLARPPRSDRGRRRMPADLQALIEGLALRRPAPSTAAIHRLAIQVATKHGWTAPSYACVYDVVSSLDPAMVALAQEGARGYAERFDLIWRREAEGPNEIWQADHTELDLWVVGPDGDPCRPWLTVVEDDYSRALAGWSLNLTAPSALQTALTLRRAIWRKAEPGWTVCGIPGVLYVDHGSDFTSRHLEQVAADLKMRLVFSTVGQPRGRGKVERFFGVLNELLLSALPGYAPAGARPPVPMLSVAELDARLHRFVVEEYQRRPHSETGVAPQERWEAGGFLPHLPASLEALDLLLLTVAEPRKVHPDGIRFQGLRYFDPTLAGYVGEPVTIRYDPNDMGEVRVFHRDAFVCRAVSAEIATQSLTLKDVTAARRARRQDLRHGINQRLSVVDRLLAVHEPDQPPPADATRSTPPRAILKRYRDD
jgi:putative transposase